MEQPRYALRVLLHWARDGLGPPLLSQLKERGCWVRAVVPDPALRDQLPNCDDVVLNDGNEADLLQACRGMDAVLTWAMPWLRFSRTCGGDADPRRHERLLAAARRSGTSHFVLVTGMQSEAMARRWPELGAFEHLVHELCQSDLSWLVIRCPAVFDHLDHLIPLARRGTLYLPQNGRALINPIHAVDLSSELVGLLLDSSARMRVVAIGGPEVLSLREIGERAYEALDRPARIRNLSAGMLTVIADMISPFIPTLSQHLGQVQALTGTDMVAPPFGTKRIDQWLREVAKRP
jgi:uncharacterized protein YbjT (DUF2867 family)